LELLTVYVIILSGGSIYSIGAVSYAQDLPSSPPPNWLNYTSTKHNITLHYPFNADLEEGKETRYDADKDLSISVFPEWIFSVGQYQLMRSNPSLDETAQNHIEWSLTDRDDYDGEYPTLIWGPNQTRIGGEPAISALISYINEDSKKSEHVSEVHYVRHNDSQYMFQYVVITEHYDSTQEERDWIMDSIKFTN
jgi:hypothetical protein